jgi:regulator of protease activity HflC (stomatin/prohibitin superfamily)
MDSPGGIALTFVLAVLIIFVIIVLVRSVRIVPQARAGVVERLGKYQRTLNPGLTLLIPFVDRLLPLLDLREQVVSFPPQPVITEDNLVVSIDTVVYFQVTDPRAATYEIANYIQAVEQLTTTTLRNVVGGLNLEEALTSRDQINGQLRGVLDEATGRWGHPRLPGGTEGHRPAALHPGFDGEADEGRT